MSETIRGFASATLDDVRRWRVKVRHISCTITQSRTQRNGPMRKNACCYIPDAMVQELFGKGPKLGIQVRILGTRLGIYKGVFS